MKQVRVLEAGLSLEDRVEPHHIGDVVSLTDDQYARLPADAFGVAVVDVTTGGSSLLADPSRWVSWTDQAGYTSGVAETLNWTTPTEHGPSFIELGNYAKGADLLTFLEAATIVIYVDVSVSQSIDADGSIALQFAGTAVSNPASPFAAGPSQVIHKFDPGYHYPDETWTSPPGRVAAGETLIISAMTGLTAGTLADNGTNLQIVRLS